MGKDNAIEREIKQRNQLSNYSPAFRRDCFSPLSSPPASPEGEADGGQVESGEAKNNPGNPVNPVGKKLF